MEKVSGEITNQNLIESGIMINHCRIIRELADKLNLKLMGIKQNTQFRNFKTVYTNDMTTVIISDDASDIVIFSIKTNHHQLREMSLYYNNGDNLEKYYHDCIRVYKACKLTNGFGSQVTRKTVNEIANIISVALAFNIDYALIAYNKGNWGVEIKTLEFGTEPIFIAYFTSPSTGSSVCRINFNKNNLSCGLRLTKEIQERVIKIWNKIER